MSSAVHNCCESRLLSQNSTGDRLFRLLEKVSAAALGAFAAYASFELFISFFALGIGVGIFSEPQHRAAHGSSSCSQGLLEQLTGVKLPKMVSLGANLAITWCHIDHHTTVFVPLIALSLGAWAGQSLRPNRVVPA